MAYNSELKDGLDLNSGKIHQSCENDDLSPGPDLDVKDEGADGCMDDDELRALFVQVVSFFLKEVSVNKKKFRPFPPKLGDGQDADLFKLFLTVRRIGSYESVSENNMWEFVAKECGLEVEVVSSLKLIYVKYLQELDQWLIEGGFKDEKVENVEIGVIEKLDLLSRQLDGYKSSDLVGFEDVEKGKCIDIGGLGYNEGNVGDKKNEGTSGFYQNDEGINLDDMEFSVGEEKICDLSPENVFKKVGFSMINDEIKRSELSPENVVKKVGLSVIHDDDNVVKRVDTSTINDEDEDEDEDDDDDDDDEKEFSVEGDGQVSPSTKIFLNERIRFRSGSDVTLTANDGNIVSHYVKNVEKVTSSQKRKREEESLPLLEMVDWITNAAKDPHDIAFETSRRSLKWKSYTIEKLWKQALLAKRALFVQPNIETGNDASGSQKKNQRMHPSMYEDGKVSSRGTCSRSANSAQPCSCANCILRTSSRVKRQRTEPGKFTTDRTHENIEPDDQEYNLGPLYQAEVPAWTGPVYDSDPKWLGTQMWPPPDDHEEDTVTIGLGRENTCKWECLFPGSSECVRFHIAENRFKLKIELGPLFYKWDFHKMGEEVSLPWEPEEEKRFKTLVVKARQDLVHSNKSRHDIMNRFWRRASEIIPAKPKHKLVSYYFNVFVLRRRSYQNRVTPRDIDSDNDDEEVGSVGDRFGYEKIHGLSIKCLENMQCTELES